MDQLDSGLLSPLYQTILPTSASWYNTFCLLMRLILFQLQMIMQLLASLFPYPLFRVVNPKYHEKDDPNTERIAAHV